MKKIFILGVLMLSFMVAQAGAQCTYSISPTSQSFDYPGGTGTVNIKTQTGCSWRSISNDNWITITSGTSGSGNGTVGFSVSANTSTSQRTGTMTIAGQTFTVKQDGTPITECATWSDVIAKYQAYKNGQATFGDVIDCFREWRENRTQE